MSLQQKVIESDLQNRFERGHTFLLSDSVNLYPVALCSTKDKVYSSSTAIDCYQSEASPKLPGLIHISKCSNLQLIFW
jgi:hypothetical protein